VSNIGSYNERNSNFNWSIYEKELEYEEGSVINIGWYCTDRICNKGLGSKIALIWEGLDGNEKKYTYDQIRVLSNTFAKFLQSNGVVNEDRVCLFMDRIPELYIGFISILKLGAITQPLFSAFGKDSLFIRLEDARAKVIITQRRHVSKVRKIINKMPFLGKVIVVDADDNKKLKEREVSFSLEASEPVEDFKPFETYKESPSVLHYTSGTTGKPKGVKHVHYSIISQYLTSKWVLDLKNTDIYWCTADPGWVTGTSYGIIGPWSLGITQCVLDTGFSAETWYKFIEKHEITVLYSAPTAIRLLMKAGDDIVRKYDLSS